MLAYSKSYRRSYINISKSRLQKMLKSNNNFLLIDVRTPLEYNQGHIMGAINIPLDQLEYNIYGISNYKNSPVVVYCKVGKRSLIAAETLVNNGFINVYNLSGGYDSYNRKIKR